MQIKLFINLTKSFCIKQRKMALFIQVRNPITGKNEWETHDDDSYDYHQEVANAGFGDMLHDWERNRKYYAALLKTIKQMKSINQEVHVLDIGTGTGILSMMAVAAGADTVTACEAFMPMANCAEKILQANGMIDKVRLIKKRSTELLVGVDMKRKANLLVSEVLDTELIGEGAISIYNHAHENLLSDDVTCIPAKATCYAQVVQSSLAAQWNTMKILPNLDGDALLKPPKEVLNCKGEAALHDVQVSQLPLDHIRPLTEPLKIFEFDFNRKKAREAERENNVKVKSISAGSTDLVLYWWEIEMDLQSEIVLSCAPFWAHPEFKELAAKKSAQHPLPNIVPWRDHWMQAIYYIPKPLKLISANVEFTLCCNHDEYSLWFDAFSHNHSPLPQRIPRHVCTCSLHMTYSRSRIGQINQAQRNKRFMQYLEESIQKDSEVLVLGDGCLLGLAIAKLDAAKSVVCHEPHRFSRRFMQSIVEENSLGTVRFVEKLNDLENATTLTHIFAEPYFLTSILPWDNLYFGTLLLQLKDKLLPTVQIAPHSAHIYAMPVEFLDLHKIRTPIGYCEGFDLSLFDEMVKGSMDVAQAQIEAQPLWEYPCRALAQPQEVLEVVFSTFEENKNTAGLINIEESGSCNGIVLWVDWHIDDSNKPKSIVSTGPTAPIQAGHYVKWDIFVRQGVHLIGNAQQVAKNASEVRWKVAFNPKVGEFNFSFDVAA